ncbi:MAG: hypothetical protein ACO1SX_26640, partial [Actinomycetota bacterium]
MAPEKLASGDSTFYHHSLPAGKPPPARLDRRSLLAAAAAALLANGRAAHSAPAATEFQVACMTYVYRAFPLERALQGIARSGYRYVAWGTEHE